MLKNLLNLFNSVFPFRDFLYVLQLEEYDNKRYFQRLKRFSWKRHIEKRDTLKFTSRIQTTLMLSIGIYFVSLIIVIIFPLFFFVSCLLIPVYVGLANNLLTPFYEMMKLRLQKRAAEVVKLHKNLRIIAIAGSYGKTTTKNFLYELVRYEYKTQMVPGNINTPTGIAAWVLRELNPGTELLLVEMDTYFLGEIKRSCMVTTPDISVITSIGDQHIERFGTQKKMAAAILEVFTCAKESAKRYIYASEYEKIITLGIKPMNDVTQLTENKHQLKTNITSKSAYKDLVLAFEIAQELNISKKIILDSLKNLEHPDRRQKHISSEGYDLIDDSYNISATTAREGVQAAKNVAKSLRKKVLVVTAGIPEVGHADRFANTEYGSYLEAEVDNVIVLKSIFYKELKRNGFDTALNVPDAWKIIKKKYPSKDYVILMQPELTDLYY